MQYDPPGSHIVVHPVPLHMNNNLFHHFQSSISCRRVSADAMMLNKSNTDDVGVMIDESSTDARLMRREQYVRYRMTEH